MDPSTFDTLARRLASAPSRRQLLKTLVGVGAGALATTRGRDPAQAQVCIALPCRADPGRCQRSGPASCVCCRLPGGATQCLNRPVCQGSFGTIVEPPLVCGDPCELANDLCPVDCPCDLDPDFEVNVCGGCVPPGCGF